MVRIVTVMVWTHTGTPEILPVTVKGIMLLAMPPMGISTRVVIFWVRTTWWIWFGLGAQGA